MQKGGCSGKARAFCFGKTVRKRMFFFLGGVGSETLERFFLSSFLENVLDGKNGLFFDLIRVLLGE